MEKENFDFWAWFRSSCEETPGRASGKALSSLFLVGFLMILGFIILFYSKIFSDDLKQNQADLLGTIISGVLFLIGSLYGIKAALKSKWFSGNGNGTDTQDPVDNTNKQNIATNNPVVPPPNPGEDKS